MTNKIIYHYSNGETYTLKGKDVYSLHWDEEYMVVGPGVRSPASVELPQDTLAIEQHDEDGNIYIYKNPHYNLSIEVDVKTVRSRYKINNSRKDFFDKIFNLLKYNSNAIKEINDLTRKNK